MGSPFDGGPPHDGRLLPRLSSDLFDPAEPGHRCPADELPPGYPDARADKIDARAAQAPHLLLRKFPARHECTRWRTALLAGVHARTAHRPELHRPAQSTDHSFRSLQLPELSPAHRGDRGVCGGNLEI